MRGGIVRTRNGRRVRIIATDRIGDKPIVALVRQEPPSDDDEYYEPPFNLEDCRCYYENGRYLDYDTDEDLFLVVPKWYVK